MNKLLSFFLLLSTLTISSFAQDKIAKGSSVKILEIAKSDSYYSDRADFVGKDATALGELTKGKDGFYSGTLETSSGRTVFFTDVKVAVINSSVKTKTDAGSEFSGTTIPKGTKFKVIEVPSDDAYYSDRIEIEGQTGTTKSDLTIDENGYTSGSIELDNGKSYYFYKVKLGKTTGSSSSKTTSGSSFTVSSSSLKTPKYITGTIKSGTSLYVADISPDDSYYSDRFDKVGKKGKIGKDDLTMKEDGYYAGDFTYDDGSTAYFYKVKFSIEPVDKLIKPATEENSKSNSSDDDWDLFLDTPSNSTKSSDTDGQKIWSEAKNDSDIKEGDKVEVTAVSPEDSYYEDRDEYIGKKGIAGNDLDYNEDDGGYGGSVKLDDGSSPYFYLVKLKKLSGSTTSSKTSTSSSTSSDASSIAKGTRVQVVDLDMDDSYYASKEKYIRKIGKVADGLSSQGNACYSGKIVFEDGTDAYFYKVKIKVLK